MKKICRTITLKKFESEINDCKDIKGEDFMVLFDDGKYERVYLKYDLIKILENDHVRSINYIFDMTDRILVRRDVLINTDEVTKC
ncbi:MAG: hypothetical protein NC483_00625 [Ruminococcus sp.]|nr:hypothetical protein [Ruminococcus sp.]